MQVEIEHTGDVQVLRKLIRFEGSLQDASPAFREIGVAFRENERRQFDIDGAYGSGGWQELAPATVARKLASDNPIIRANATRILRATGESERSLTGDGPGHVEVIQPHQGTYGSTIPQARYHQPDPQGRRMLEVPDHGRRDFVRILQRHLVSTLEGAALRGLA